VEIKVGKKKNKSSELNTTKTRVTKNKLNTMNYRGRTGVEIDIEDENYD
jgi:DUF2075 family protein